MVVFLALPEEEKKKFGLGRQTDPLHTISRPFEAILTSRNIKMKYIF